MLSAALGDGAQKAFALSPSRCGKFSPSFTLAVVLDEPTERFSRELGVVLRRLTLTVDRDPVCRIELRCAEGATNANARSLADADIPHRLAVTGDLPMQGAEPDVLVETSLGPLASDETRKTIRGAESRQQALVLLLMAPEFQRR